MEVTLTNKGRQVLEQRPGHGAAIAMLDHLNRYGAADVDEMAAALGMEKGMARRVAQTLFQRKYIQRGAS